MLWLRSFCQRTGSLQKSDSDAKKAHFSKADDER